MKLDIYNSENIKSLSSDIYKPPSLLVLCHTTFLDYKAGEEYKLTPEVVAPKKDTNNKECILCWINSNPGFGSRFSIVGNIYNEDKPLWVNFLDYFVCPVARERNEKLKEIGI
jgi:hypothetical protein